MAKTRSQKTELLNKYKEILKNKTGYFLVNSDKTDTVTVSKLKMELKNVNANYTVLKNTLFKVALQDSDQPLEIQEIDGPTAIIYFDEDPTAPAKLIKEMQKETDLLNAKSGVYEGLFLTEQEVMQLAEIPTKEVLLAQLVGTLNAPLSGFVNAATGNIRGLTMVLKGISEKDA
ncbi:MAG: 50S ribosomal protein L10 [Candidatus Dojkabacteria bacterium]|jgi:large subunit ribosomal protein L10|nr:50S ribosomal protein L10 [Candidatus Dojkabacteria bacterium]MDD4560825.1 50S ribosomal protein L10 [Candidatus Dojkabacteria bacterium]NLB12187.1 50S ribosomal protein L10 [Candidatus Dojkabacteria bacterium]